MVLAIQRSSQDAANPGALMGAGNGALMGTGNRVLGLDARDA
jgi:hypothetical protein